MKKGPENESPLFKNYPCLLAICEYVAEKLGEEVNPKTMLRTIKALKDNFNPGERRKKKPGNKWGCKGCPTIVNNDMENQINW